MTSTKYITMFDTTWAYGNEYVKMLFAELSNEYTSLSTVFLHVDLTRSQELADQLKVNISGYSGEIPVFICFCKGKEVCRVPEFSEKPRTGTYRWTKEILLRAFKLGKVESKKTKYLCLFSNCG
ncbi:uncharacterized protein [Blastocystis hominis]|uniref:Thioredoxin domain-containing protein n=1 Tax=Blastocystis hominis TaxID=12968 RepID=D8LY32_BLAHO|nr:uncharacterized protein [Blastocystis hominis]CBK20487.2 unnamed protein product [Blastocystis hominis]|eukprot:XP_012894535.1 uncharacterized protein [Blastocystis hominis]